jgi:hypothetical protein
MMKLQNHWRVTIASLIFLVVLASCGNFLRQGEAVVTVTGKITETNKGDSYVLHQLDFDNGSVVGAYNDPWIKDTISYKGLLLKDILNIVKPVPGAKEMIFKNVNGQTYSVSIGDASNWDIMLARWEEKDKLVQATGYPTKLVFPDSAKDEYGPEMWGWWINSIEIK